MRAVNPLPPAATSGLIAEAVVDLEAIAHNVRVLAEHAGSAQVMAVVKADGYGHGAVPVARAAVAAGAAELGVATVDEALDLRAAGISAPVLAWLHGPDTDFGPALAADIQIAVSSPRQLSALLDAVYRTSHSATVTVKADTGMNRNGVDPREFPDLLDMLRRGVADEALHVRGLMSHLACADEPGHPSINAQARQFADLLAYARECGVPFEVAHLANSPAALTRPDLAYDLIRPGIAVYGLNPLPQHGDLGLVPAMTLKCVVALVRSLRAGEAVSYGHTWVADRDTTVALLPLGYADGVFRLLSGRFEVLINGQLRRSVGRVCMDQFVVDLGPGPVDVHEGDEAVLFGSGRHGEPTAQDWADTLGTIHYEVVTGPRGRVTRTYRG